MGRNTADAVCERCGQTFQWLIGTLRICGKCQKKDRKGKNKNGKKG